MAIFFKINNKSICSPKEIQHSFNYLDKVERTMDGTMVVDIVGRKRKIDVKWENISKREMSSIIKETEKSIFVNISFHDTISGELLEVTARVDSTVYTPSYDWVKKEVRWQMLTITFIER